MSDFDEPAIQVPGAGGSASNGTDTATRTSRRQRLRNKEPRPKSTWAAIATVPIVACAAGVGYLTWRSSSELPPPVVAAASDPRLDTLSDFGCGENPSALVTYFVPQLRGSANDDDFNLSAQATALALLIEGGLPADFIEIFQGPRAFQPQALRTIGCTIPADNNSWLSLYLDFDVTLITPEYVSALFKSGSYGFMGHEYGKVEGFVYDVEAGRQLGVDDLFGLL